MIRATIISIFLTTIQANEILLISLKVLCAKKLFTLRRLLEKCAIEVNIIDDSEDSNQGKPDDSFILTGQKSRIGEFTFEQNGKEYASLLRLSIRTGMKCLFKRLLFPAFQFFFFFPTQQNYFPIFWEVVITALPSFQYFVFATWLLLLALYRLLTSALCHTLSKLLLPFNHLIILYLFKTTTLLQSSTFRKVHALIVYRCYRSPLRNHQDVRRRVSAGKITFPTSCQSSTYMPSPSVRDLRSQSV